MEFRKVEGMHKDRVTTNIFVPVIREPMSNLHDEVERETAGSKVSGTSCSDGMACYVVGEV